MKGFGSSVLLCILVPIVLVLAKPPDWIPADMLDMVKADKNRCMNEHGTTQALIDEVNDGKLENDRHITCYMYCLFEAFSLADEEGNVDADLITSIMPEHLQATAADVFGACAIQDGADPCDKLFNVAKCAQSRRPDMWFMI